MNPSILDSRSISVPEVDSRRSVLQEGAVCLYAPGTQRYFRDPIQVYSTCDVGQVTSLLNTIDARVRDEGLYAAGYLAYEAAPAFDSALAVKPTGDEPLLWFGLYEEYSERLPERIDESSPELVWRPEMDRRAFDGAIERIRDYIAAGDTYQVNFTFPMTAEFNGDAYGWFRALCDAQQASHCAYVHAGDRHVISVSPELFFSLDGDRLVTRPMKGTIARGLTEEADCDQAVRLRESAKDRAENVMIVDMLRNDMGRISETGSVTVDSLFEVERYDTLWQMTSTIRSRTEANVPEILGALFPSGSITGAPKIRTSEIIAELETGPRGAYCGTLGWWGPERQAEFNVAIRTATYDVADGRLTYPVGAGITWESRSASEHAECLLKAEIVTKPHPAIALLESLLWDGEYFLLERHLERLAESAAYFGFDYDAARVRETLDDAARAFGGVALKVRVLYSRDGEVNCDWAPVGEVRPWRVGIAERPVDLRDVYLYHKTTNRDMYDAALRGQELDDVILWNERGEVTESTRANVIALIDGVWVTPPISCGLLGGTYRAELLDRGEIMERVISLEELKMAEDVQLINSVRRRIEIEFIQGLGS